MLSVWAAVLGVQYPTAYVEMDDLVVRIGTTDLNEKLMNEDGSYASETARCIDEKMYYFVDVKYLENKDELLQIVKEVA